MDDRDVIECFKHGFNIFVAIGKFRNVSDDKCNKYGYDDIEDITIYALTFGDYGGYYNYCLDNTGHDVISDYIADIIDDVKFLSVVKSELDKFSMYQVGKISRIVSYEKFEVSFDATTKYSSRWIGNRFGLFMNCVMAIHLKMYMKLGLELNSFCFNHLPTFYSFNGSEFELQNNREIDLLFNKNIDNYKMENIWANEDFVLSRVEECTEMFKYADDIIKNDKEFILKSIQFDNDVLDYISDNLKDDKEFIIKVVEEDAIALKYASYRLQNDIDLLRLLKNSDVLLSYNERVYYKERMERLKILDFENELLNSIPINSNNKKINKF